MKKIKLISTLMAFAGILMLTSCTDMFENAITTTGSTTSSSLSSIVRTSSVTDLDTPEQIFVSNYESADTMSISWSSVDNADYYVLERAIVDPTDAEANDPPEDDDFTVLRNQVFGTSYDDAILSSATYSSEAYVNGYKYYYRVSAAAEDYTTSDPTDNETYGQLLAPVMTVKATMGASTTDVGISWTAATNAASYKIYRSRYTDGSEPTLLGSVKSNLLAYTNEIDSADQGVEFYYSVIAVTSQGEKSVSSPLAMGYALVEGAPGAPTMVYSDTYMRATDSSFKVQWEAVTTGSTTYYTIYYSTSTDSSIVQLADKITATNYTVQKGLKTGIYYYYYVKAWLYDDDGTTKINGAMSTDEYECFLLSPPSSVVATKNSDGTQNVAFTEAIGSDDEKAAYTYNIYGCDTQNGTYEVVLSGTTNASASDGTITAVVSDTRTFYYVTTCYNSIESDASTIVAPACYPPASITVTRNAAISGTTASYDVAASDGGPNEQGVMPVQITWTAASAGDSCGYIVYRAKYNQKKLKYGSFSAITDVLSNSTLTYIDANEDAAQEEIYGYKVLSVNILGKGAASSYTDPYWGYGALCVEQLMAQSSITSKYAQRSPSQGGGLVSLNKTSDTDKMTGGAWEYNYGQVSGQVGYTASLKTSGSVMGADVVMPYTNYADFFIYTPDGTLTTTIMDGECNTFAGADLLAGFVISGNLYGTMNLTGMYTGQIIYGNSKGDGYATIGTKADGTSGVNGGGYYVTTSGYAKRWVDWTWGE